MGFLDSLRGLFAGKKKTRPSGVRRGALPPRRADVPTQQIQRIPVAGGPAAHGPAPLPSAHADLRPQPMLDRPEPIASPPPAREPWAAPPPRRPAPTGPPSHSSGAGETRYHKVPGAMAGKTVGVLVAVDGELEGEVYRVPDGESLLGREHGVCQVVLPSEWISRQHAKMKHQDGLFVIAPVSDKNPTFVNDERTEGTELKDGDFLRLGKTTFRFRTVA